MSLLQDSLSKGKEKNQYRDENKKKIRKILHPIYEDINEKKEE